MQKTANDDSSNMLQKPAETRRNPQYERKYSSLALNFGGLRQHGVELSGDSRYDHRPFDKIPDMFRVIGGFKYGDGLILGIDAGQDESGVALIRKNDILAAAVLNNAEVRRLCGVLPKGCTVVLEDIAPYSVAMRTSTILTIKFLGYLEGFFRDNGISYKTLFRWQVKMYVYDAALHAVLPVIEKKVSRLKERDVEEKKRSASFVYVGDQIVIKGMKHLWGLPPRKMKGLGYPFGLITHSWQALAVATAYANGTRY